MDWLKNIVGLAPSLGAALGGPLGGMAGKFLADALGVEESDLPKAVADPTMMLRIQQADYDFKVKLRDLGIQEAAIHAGDRASARDRESKVGGNTVPLLAWSIIFGSFGLYWFVLSGNLNEIAIDPTLRGSIVGYASGLAVQVVSYYFGSSAGQDHVK